ncbi:Fanconi anemia group I protein-like isoform X2 [Halichondria panicea]|uniref:Fanconi anemia group I protein-like isoform X2 n=1 Tax=Halichondria panicea TaxID=6063 RepID=UPI00312B2C6D
MIKRGSPSNLSPRKLQRPKQNQRVWTEDNVGSHLERVFTSGDQHPAKVVREVLEECKKDEQEPCRKEVFKKCIEALNSNHLHTEVAKEIVGKLLFEVNSLSGPSQVAIAEIIIKGLKEGHHPSLELFPKLISTITSRKVIRYPKPGGGYGEMMGEDHKSHLMNSLFGCRWDPSCVLHVTDMCKDIAMSEDELKFLIQKILQIMESLPVTEIPPLIYQLLSLSKKGHKMLILDGIKSLFDNLDTIQSKQEPETEDSVTTNNEKELLTTEGTVFVHVTYAIKQDTQLRKEYLKMLKTAQERLSSGEVSLFSVTLALSAVSIHKLEEMDIVLKAYKDEERTNSSKWIKEATEDLVDIESLLMTTINHSTSGWTRALHGSGWDQVVQGLVAVGLHLMETFGPKSSALSQYGTPQRKVCALGSKILAETFKKHSGVHCDIVSQIVNCVMTNSASHVSHYIDLLSQITRNASPMDFVDSLPKLKESLSYIAMISSQSAGQLLTAILPLVQFSSSLRDCLLLVLRKALFSINVEARKTAVEGYLLLLRKFTVLDSVGSLDDSQNFSATSQVTVEVHGNGHNGNEALCLEILGTLRRALTKQYNVKLSLYEGLYSVFCANRKLAGSILDLLLTHFTLFYEHETDITPPIKLNPCVKMSGSDVTAAEPLDHLVCCLQLCVCHYLERDEDDEEPPEIIGEVQRTLSSLVTRMIASELDDFELNKSSDFSTSSVGQKNRLFAQLAMGTYEALLEYTFSTGQFSLESSEQVLKLYQCYQHLADALSDKGSSAAAGPSSNKRGTSAVPSRLSLHCVVRLLRAIFHNQTPNHQQALTVLRESQPFSKYILGVAVQKIHQIHDTGVCDGSSLAKHKPDHVFKTCCSLAKLMFKHIEVGGARPSKKEKGKSVALYCLEGFSQLLHTAIVRWERGGAFLAAVNPSLNQTTGDNEKTHYFIRHLQRVVGGVLDGSTKEWSLKEAQLMVASIELLTGTLELGSQELDQVFEWAYAQCRDHNVDDSPLTKALISLLLIAAERHKSCVKTIRKLAQDVHYHLGDIDEDIELEATTCFSIVNPRTAASNILALLYSHMEQILASTDWLVDRLKMEISSSPTEDAFGRPCSQVPTQSRDTFSSLCDRLTHLVFGGSDLVQSSVAAGPSSEGLLKMLVKFFYTLSNLAKYVLDVYQFTSNIPAWFKKLVNLVGTQLSQQVYLFITYIQKMQMQSGAMVDAGGGKKGGKGKSKVNGTGKASIRKESRTYSNLIFSMEQFEKHLIQLDKKAKGNLMEPFKYSMSRDFRIDSQAVGSILEEDEVSSDEDEEEEECGPSSAKRPKKN